MPPRTAEPFVARRQHWQLPIFLLGVAALVGIWHYRPTRTAPAAGVLEPALKQVREALEQPNADYAQLIGQLKALVPQVDRAPQFAGEVHFLLGSAALKRSEAVTGNDAAEALRAARDSLDQADKWGVARDDRSRLDYRLARALELTGGEPRRSIDLLVRSVEACEDVSEGYRLLASAYLRATPPEPRRALEATKKQLERATPGTPPNTLTAARLRLAEMQLQTRDTTAARATLTQLATDGPAEFRAAAKARLAQSYQDENNPTAAATAYREARELVKDKPEAWGAYQYQLGASLSAAGQTSEASAAWDEAVKKTGGAPAQASALRLAAVKAGQPNQAAAAAELAEGALRGVNQAAEYTNALLPLADARTAVERLVFAARQSGDFNSAARLARAYRRIAAPGRDQQLLAETAEECARSLARSTAQADQQAALAHFRTAATEYEALAAAAKGQPAEVDWLRKAAAARKDAKERPEALKLLERAAQLPNAATRKGELYGDLADLQHDGDDPQKAIEAYRKTAESGQTLAPKARYQLALLHQRVNQPDAAEKELRALVDAPDTPRDADTHEKSLFALAAMVYQQGKFAEAEGLLDRAGKAFPESALALTGLFQYGRCLYYRAAEENREAQKAELAPEQKAQQQRAYRETLQRALTAFDRVEAALLKKQVSQPLATEEADTLLQASFRVADCYFYLGQNYDEALRRYKLLAFRYGKQVGHLLALANLWQSYRHLAKPDLAEAALNDFAAALEKMEDGAFDRSSETLTRTYWERWYALALLNSGSDAASRQELEKAAEFFTRMSQHYKHHVEGLMALQRLWDLQTNAQRQPDAAKQTLKTMQEWLAQMKDDRFDPTSPGIDYKRSFWEKWVSGAAGTTTVSAPTAGVSAGGPPGLSAPK